MRIFAVGICIRVGCRTHLQTASWNVVSTVRASLSTFPFWSSRVSLMKFNLKDWIARGCNREELMTLGQEGWPRRHDRRRTSALGILDAMAGKRAWLEPYGGLFQACAAAGKENLELIEFDWIKLFCRTSLDVWKAVSNRINPKDWGRAFPGISNCETSIPFQPIHCLNFADSSRFSYLDLLRWEVNA